MGINEAAGYGAASLAAIAAGFLAATYALRPQPFLLALWYSRWQGQCCRSSSSVSRTAMRVTRRYILAHPSGHAPESAQQRS